jgi:TATA-box binding protein (TBP) (component of TFIID and TFIIIB)
MTRTTIVNVVATADLNQEVDLFELANLKEIVYDSEIYGGRVAYFKLSDMEGKVSIFSSGKMISVGTKSDKTAF